jgi:hypothetical protein
MKKILLVLIFGFPIFHGHTQDIICSLADREAIASKIETISDLKKDDFGETIVAVGKTFIGIPYVAKTLEVGETESLVINLQGMDCTTYVENVLTFSLMLEQQRKDFDSYAKNLKTIRYKDGKLEGYASRLHYFSEWIANNEKKGFLKDMTPTIGGAQVHKDINFMSTHRELYPFLKDPENFKKIQESEQFLKIKPLCVLPKDQIQANEHLIKTGDIIALTTSIQGLDITHTGFASREADGRIHLLHASTGSLLVELSKLPLTEYLKGIKSNTGIIVARPIN